MLVQKGKKGGYSKHELPYQITSSSQDTHDTFSYDSSSRSSKLTCPNGHQLIEGCHEGCKNERKYIANRLDNYDPYTSSLTADNGVKIMTSNDWIILPASAHKRVRMDPKFALLNGEQQEHASELFFSSESEDYSAQNTLHIPEKLAYLSKRCQVMAPEVKEEDLSSIQSIPHYLEQKDRPSYLEDHKESEEPRSKEEEWFLEVPTPDEQIVNEVNTRRRGRKKGEGSQYQRKTKGKRKARTTITPNKIDILNKAFQQRELQSETGKPTGCLKDLVKAVNLGYSTILHKYRQFRSKGQVKGGALIESLQRKRKYNKSLVVERVIQECLNEQAFYSAIELCQYIQKKYGKTYTRSIINRHLIEMGYSLKSITATPVQIDPQISRIRKIYAQILTSTLADKGKLLLYIDEMVCRPAMFAKSKFKDQGSVSLMVAATKQGVIRHQLAEREFTKKDFAHFVDQCIPLLLKQIQKLQIVYESLVLITDLKKIHYDAEGESTADIKPIVEKYRLSRLFLSPYSPDLNPLDYLFVNLKRKIKNSPSAYDSLKEVMGREINRMSREPVEVYFNAVSSAAELVRLGRSTKMEETADNWMSQYLSFE